MVALDSQEASNRKWMKYGGVMAILGSGLFFTLDPLLNMALKSQMNLDPDGPVFGVWKEAPLSVTYKFYIFNIDNPNEALRGEKLRVSERGPFTFKQWRRKEIIGWAPDKSTVQFYEYKKYFIDYENTVGSFDDEITIINPLIAGFGATITKISREDIPIPMVLSPFIYGAVNGLFGIHGEGLFATQTVGDLLFGKRVRMLDTITSLLKPLEWIGVELPIPKDAMPPNNTVGLLYGRNNTPEGPYEVYTGLTNAGPAFHFASWKGQKKLKFWSSEQCNMINGSDGSLFKPFIDKEERLYAFGADVCRSIYLKFIKESEFKGIPTYQYSLPDDFLVGIDKNPWNECFCFHKDKAKCRVDGMYDLGGCQFGAPLILSTPHFLNYPHLQRMVDGLTPNEKDHGTYVEIQPMLGAPLFGIKRLMFALRVESNPSIRAFKNIKTAYIPFVWAEEGGGLDDDMAGMLRNFIIRPIQGASVVSGGVGAAGAALFAGAFARDRLRRRNTKSNGNNNTSAAKPTETTETKISIVDK